MNVPIKKSKLRSLINTSIKKNLSNLYYFKEIDSTNNYLLHKKPNNSKEIIDASVKNHIDICVTDHQTNGRGRQKSKWLSPKNTNILMSIKIFNTLETRYRDILSRIISLTVINAISTHITSTKDILRVKPPNDIYVNNLKLSGILIETTKNPDLVDDFYWVIGIGINVYNAPITNHTISLHQCATLSPQNNTHIREILIAEICHQLYDIIVNHNLQEYDIYCIDYNNKLK